MSRLYGRSEDRRMINIVIQINNGKLQAGNQVNKADANELALAITQLKSFENDLLNEYSKVTNKQRIEKE